MANRRPLTLISGYGRGLPTGDGVNAGVQVAAQSASANIVKLVVLNDNDGDQVCSIAFADQDDGNLFIGNVSPPSTITGVNNIFIVTGAGPNCEDLTSAQDNMCIGTEAGRDLSSGAGNMLFGERAGRLINTGSNNMCIGSESGDAITSGGNNTLIGTAAGSAIQTTSNNTLLGFNCGVAITGDQNTGIGVNALNPATAVSFNTAIGVDALGGLTTGADENTAIGIRAGNSVTTGGSNTFIGCDAGNNASQLVTAASSTAIGHDAFTTASNQVVIGASNVTHTILRGSAAASGVEIVNSTTAQALHVYNTFTSSTSYERLTFTWDTNVCEIQTEKGSGGGTARALALGTDGTVRTQIGATGVVASGSCFQPGYVIAGYGVGTAYTVTNSSAEIDRGTTDSAIVLDQAGTYLLTGHVTLAYNAATFASGLITLKLRRTNNTAADIANSSVAALAFVLTTFTGGLQLATAPASYTTAATDDRIALFIDVSAGPSAGTLTVTHDSIFAERTA